MSQHYPTQADFDSHMSRMFERHMAEYDRKMRAFEELRGKLESSRLIFDDFGRSTSVSSKQITSKAAQCGTCYHDVIMYQLALVNMLEHPGLEQRAEAIVTKEPIHDPATIFYSRCFYEQGWRELIQTYTGHFELGDLLMIGSTRYTVIEITEQYFPSGADPCEPWGPGLLLDRPLEEPILCGQEIVKVGKWDLAKSFWSPIFREHS